MLYKAVLVEYYPPFLLVREIVVPSDWVIVQQDMLKKNIEVLSGYCFFETENSLASVCCLYVR
ncbi:MAG: hypothetical protein PHZ02_09840 [Desulfocapsaceae bacterium]|nr:hypothetical protein [Desulfocapsaceae bacterium]